MADQTVRIENLPNVTNGSPERVAYELYQFLCPSRTEGMGAEERKTQVLDLYADCLKVVKSGGYRLSELR